MGALLALPERYPADAQKGTLQGKGIVNCRRKARNKFSHEGKPLIGNQEVTREQATELIAKAKAIVAWVERLLPEEARTPKSPFESTLNTVHTII